MNQANFKILLPPNNSYNRRKSTDVISDYLTPNSQVPFDLPKSSESNTVEQLVRNFTRTSKCDDTFLNRSKPFPLPGMTSESAVLQRSQAPKTTISVVKNSPNNRNHLSARPLPPLPSTIPKPSPNHATILRTESSHSSSSYNSSVSSLSAHSGLSAHAGHSARYVFPSTFVDTDSDLKVHDWFHENISRTEAESRLMKLKKKGGFLIRYKQERSHDIPYSLSVFCDKVYHLQIRFLVSQNRYALGKEKENEMTFDGLQEIVKYHKEKPIQLLRMEDSSFSGQTKLTSSPRKQ